MTSSGEASPYRSLHHALAESVIAEFLTALPQIYAGELAKIGPGEVEAREVGAQVSAVVDLNSVEVRAKLRDLIANALDERVMLVVRALG